jgi:hypothetical protein
LLWGIANLTGESLEYRDDALQKNIIPMLIKSVRDYEDDEKVLGACVWLGGNLLRGPPFPAQEYVNYLLLAVI